MAAAASAGSLALQNATMGVGEPQLGPRLTDHMSGPLLVEQLNLWGAARDRELVDLRATVVGLHANLAATQVEVSTTFGQARAAVLDIVTNFRAEAETLRLHGLYEATQSVARLEQVVLEARTRFDAQDARFTENLVVIAQRLQVVETWASAEPGRVAAIIQAAPVPPWVPRSPGGTPVSFYHSPGPGAAAAAAAAWTPQRPPQHSPPASATGSAPQPQDPWAPWAQQQQQPQQQQQQPHQPDPWAAGCAGPPGIDMSGGGGGGGKGAFDSSGGKGGRPWEMRIDGRSWGDSTKLDIGTTFEGFQIWKDRALMFLSRDRPDVRRLLLWAETQSKEGLAAALHTQAAGLGIVDLTSVEFALHDGIKLVIRDGLLGRARCCVELGCELWRSLCAEWSGAAPQLKHAKARRFQDPARCKDTSDLWHKLPMWERLGEDVKLAGLDVPEWLRSAALEKLLPAQLLATLVARPELSTYDARLSWVKTQMEHTRGLQQAAAYSPGAGKDASGDVHMNSVAPAAGACEPCGEGLAWAFADAMAAGDWAQCNAINALKGGKGRKGLGKGSPGKGASGPGKGAADATAEFNGVCNYCGIWGHRKSECRRHTADLAKKGKGDKGGGKGGKGGPKGGKGPGPLLECAGEDEDAWEENDDGTGTGDDQLEAEQWLFDHAIGSVSLAPAEKHTRAKGQTFFGAASGSSLPWTYSGQGPDVFIGAASGSSLPRTYSGQGPDVLRAKGQTYSGQGPDVFIGAASGSSLPRAKGQTYAGRGPDVMRAKGQRRGTPATPVYNSFAALSLLTDDTDELICSVSGEARGGRVVEAVVDSGAVHSVAPPGCFPGPVAPSPWSRAGRGYRAANGTGIKNLGQVQVPFGTGEGHQCLIPFQVAEVEQPLLSVAHLTAAGNVCEMGHTDGRIVNLKTGRSIALERRGGVYIMKMYLPEAAPLPFRRQGA
jgi:hypothetical protein